MDKSNYKKFFDNDKSITEANYWRLCASLLYEYVEFDGLCVEDWKGWIFVMDSGILMNLNDAFFWATADCEMIPRDVLYDFLFEWSPKQRTHWIEGVRGMKMMSSENIRCDFPCCESKEKTTEGFNK